MLPRNLALWGHWSMGPLYAAALSVAFSVYTGFVRPTIYPLPSLSPTATATTTTPYHPHHHHFHPACGTPCPQHDDTRVVVLQLRCMRLGWVGSKLQKVLIVVVITV